MLQLRSALATLLELLQASPRLMALNLALATVCALLAPSFMLATGNLVQSVRDGTDLVQPLALVGAIFISTRLIEPIRGEIGQLLWP